MNDLDLQSLFQMIGGKIPHVESNDRICVGRNCSRDNMSVFRIHGLKYWQLSQLHVDISVRNYVLVSGSTFSAAIVTAAMLKEAGGSKVVFLGMPMGDDGGFWAEGLPVTLPHSRLELRPGRQFEDWDHGCHDVKRCFWPDVIWGPKAPISLQPDEEISPTFAEYAAGWDPVLERALALSR